MKFRHQSIPDNLAVLRILIMMRIKLLESVCLESAPPVLALEGNPSSLIVIWPHMRVSLWERGKPELARGCIEARVFELNSVAFEDVGA